MNVLFVDQYGDMGGAQRCLLEVVEAALGRGWRVQVALPEEGMFQERLRRLGVPVRRIACGPFAAGRKTGRDVLRFAMQWAGLGRRIGELIESEGSSLVYVNGPRALAAACAAARGRAAVLFHCHSWLKPAHAWLAGWSLRRVERTRVVAASRYVAGALEPYAGRLRVIYNGVADCSMARNGGADGLRRAGVVGRIAPEKGQMEFVQAARRLAGELGDVRFVICGAPLFGDAKAERYYQAVRRAAEGAPVEFWGWQEDVREVLARLDVLVVPSTEAECTPRVIPEAYSAGVPVVAFRSGGIPEMVEDGVTGRLARASTTEGLAEALREVLGHSENGCRGMTVRAREAWRERFSVERFQAQVLEAMEELGRSGDWRANRQTVCGS
jgi:glycosyltransferase involved in cell wall biosynthesis